MVTRVRVALCEKEAISILPSATLPWCSSLAGLLLGDVEMPSPHVQALLLRCEAEVWACLPASYLINRPNESRQFPMFASMRVVRQCYGGRCNARSVSIKAGLRHVSMIAFKDQHLL